MSQSPAAAAAASSSAAADTTPQSESPRVPLPTELPVLPASVLERRDSEFEDALKVLLRQIHPTIHLTRGSAAACWRLAAAAAHALLLGAERNGGEVRLQSDPQQPPLTQLLFYSEDSRKNSITSQEQLVFSPPIAARWLADYRAVHPQSPLQLNDDAVRDLLALVEFLLAEVLELSANIAVDRNRDFIKTKYVFLVSRIDGAAQRAQPASVAVFTFLCVAHPIHFALCMSPRVCLCVCVCVCVCVCLLP